MYDICTYKSATSTSGWWWYSLWGHGLVLSCGDDGVIKAFKMTEPCAARALKASHLIVVSQNNQGILHTHIYIHIHIYECICMYMYMCMYMYKYMYMYMCMYMYMYMYMWVDVLYGSRNRSSHSATQPLCQSGWGSHSATQPLCQSGCRICPGTTNPVDRSARFTTQTYFF